MRKRIEGREKNVSIYEKIFLVNTVIVVVGLLMMGILYNFSIKKVLTDEILGGYRLAAERCVRDVNGWVESFKNGLNLLSVSDKIQTSMQHMYHYNEDTSFVEKQNDISLQRQAIEEMAGVYPWLEETELCIYSLNRYNGTLDSMREENEDLEEVLSQIYPGQRHVQISLLADNIYLIKPVSALTFGEGHIKILGFLVCKMPLDYFFNPVNLNEMMVEVWDKYGDIIYKTGVESSGYETTVFQYGLNMGKMQIKFSMSQKQAVERIRQITVMVALFAVCLIIIMIWIMSQNIKRYRQRTEQLLEQISELGEGIFSLKEMAPGNDELAVIDRSIHEMADRLNYYIRQNVLKELEIKDAQLQALQMQINPHFLFNVLECIDSMADKYGGWDIQLLVENMAEMFRYNSSIMADERVELIQELQQVRNYIEVQKIRFPDKFDVFYNCASECMKSKTIKFILQPLVENFFRHGLEECTHKCVLEIQVKKEAGRVIVIIADDGMGIEESRLLSIREELCNYTQPRKESRKSIGLYNVNARIKMAFGEMYGIDLDSIEGEGTTVTVELPLLKNVNGIYENINC